MKKNNFQLLEEEMEKKFENASHRIKKNVVDRKGMWDLIGDLFELYIPRIFSTIVGSSAVVSGVSALDLEENEE